MEILLNGYKKEYSRFLGDFQNELPKAEAEFVWNILELYRAIYNKVSSLSIKEREQYENYKFRGFDGNEEINYYDYCKFIVEDMGRYAEISENGKNDLNSHIKTVDRYKEMLKTWQNVGKPRELSDDLFKALMNE